MERKSIIVIGVVTVVILAALAAVMLSHKGNSTSEEISQSGSTTMAEVAALWAAEFKKESGTSVTIDTPGSGTGITNFIQGKADIAQCSRAMKQSEKDQAAANNVTVTEWKVAVDGLAIITNKDNPLKALSITQLKGIYNGSITNWNQVGGSDQAIVLYGRDSASGSYASFKDMVLGSNDNYSASMQQFNTNALIVPEVENNAGGIGYVGVGYAKEASGQLSILSISKETGGTAYSPLDKRSVYAGSVNTSGYPLSRNLYIYTDGVPAKDSSQYKWVQFIMGTTGQGLVNQAGFYELQVSDLSSMQAQLAAAK